MGEQRGRDELVVKKVRIDILLTGSWRRSLEESQLGVQVNRRQSHD
jgi:hypothetical protein